MASRRGGGRRRSRSMSSEAAPGRAASFEHLKALRNVELISQNEYPLPHVQRERLRRREDSDDDANICMCTAPSEEERDAPRCDDVSCLNFATYVECTGCCPAGGACCNQRLQHPERFPELEPFLTEKKGYGVRTREDITQSSVVGEYVGEIIDQRELAQRLKSVPRHELNFYYLLLSPGIYIDARNKGSFTRFVNHSCEPNCKTEKWTVHGETRIAVVALRDIAEGEELTFDYQWKALGSRQITCYCGAPTCKGVIGTEGDVVKDESSKGYFREPTIEEIGASIIERRIRIFKSPEEQSVYSVAIVTGYDEEHDKYEVEYEGGVQGAVVDTAAEDTRETSISLEEDGWQVYCPLVGLSEDQLTKEVFSIPKRRVSGAQGTSSVENSPLPPTSTPSPSSNVASTTTSISISPSESGDRDAAEVLSTRKREMPESNKLLVKNIPRKYDETSFRRLFDERKRIDANGSYDSILRHIDLIFFEDNTGWALVELRSPEDARDFKTKLNNRPLGGSTLRVFIAGNNELDSFRRGKTKVMFLQREMSRAAESTTHASDAGNDSKDDVTEKQLDPYPYGRKLDWLVSMNEVEESASQRAGMSAALEETLRIKFVKGILHIAKRLHLDRGDATSAILALHRYFTFHPMPTNVEYHAAAMLHLFLKAHSRKVSWMDFVNEVYNEKYRSSQSVEKLSAESDSFRAQERHLVAAESELLDGLCFDLSGENPYALLDVLTTAKARKKSLPDSSNATTALSTPIPPPDVQREAKHLVAETLRLRIWMHLPVECIVLSVAYLGAAVVEAMKLRGVVSSRLILPPTPDYLPQLDPSTSSLESVMLLDCASTICTNLKDRWARLELQKSSAESKSASSNEFDTERFAVSRDKPVAISELITRLLKEWIAMPSASGSITASPIISNDKSSEFITFESLGGLLESRRSISRANSTATPMLIRRRDNTSEIISASTVFQKKAAIRAATSGSSSSATAVKLVSPTVDRLHTTDIVNVESIRKLTYLGGVSENCKCLLAGHKLYLQPWPYREEEATFSATHGIASSAARELSAALTLHSSFPDKFVKLDGIVFPEDSQEQRQPDAEADVDMEMSTLFGASGTMIVATDANGVALPATLDRLDHKKHYLAFEQPLHIYSGIFEARVGLPLRLRKKAIFDMMTALASLHDCNYVHRFVAPSHLFVYKHAIKLGGYHSVRKTAAVKDKETIVNSGSTAYTMSENERKEQCYGSWLYVTAPEVLLGETLYTWRSDMWSAGCVVLAILLDRVPFLQGQDIRVQIDLIFRLCGTPACSWEDGCKLRLYRAFKPKHDYKMRVRKTMMEQKKKYPEFPEDAIDVLEALLQLDPSKRSSAKKILDMAFFDDVRREEKRAASSEAAFDFSMLPATFPMQKKKLLQHLKSKRRHATLSSTSFSSHRHKSGKSSSSSSANGGRNSNSSSSEKSSQRHRYKRALSMDKDGGDSSDRGARRSKKRGKDGDVRTTNGDGDDDVPLPASFQFSALSVKEDGGNSGGNGSDRSAAAMAPKREKLGWGMGLTWSKPTDLAKDD